MGDGPNLARAYALETSADNQALYADWAETYDESFGTALGYQSPQEIARLWLAENDGDTPLLDVGAGTGLVAAHLDGVTVDAIDISPEMLGVAERKGLYRNCITADILKPLEIPDGRYGGVISAGTFTHGHVGAECLPELLRITRPNALFVCGVKPEILDSKGFGSALATRVARGQITPVRFTEINIYAGVEHDHKDDTVLVMQFRKR